MKTLIELVGTLITLPFIVLEAIIKVIGLILFFPIILLFAIFYPLLKYNKDVIEWITEWYKYTTTWKRGFISGEIAKLWKV